MSLYTTCEYVSGGAYFNTQETRNGLYHVLHQILTAHGIPLVKMWEYRILNIFIFYGNVYTSPVYINNNDNSRGCL